MLRFFRKYILNKFFLVVVGVILMVVFLMGNTLNRLISGGNDIAVGTIEGEDLYRSDLRRVAGELAALQQFPILGYMTQQLLGGNSGDADLVYALMLRDAQNLGLDASTAEVNGMIQTLGASEQELTAAARRMNASPDFIRQAIRHFIIVQQYRELVAGVTHMPVLDRVQLALQAANAMQQQNVMAYYSAMLLQEGSPRLSKPLLSYYLQEQNATIAGSILPISAEAYLDRVGEPGDAELQDLFQQYRDNLPGESQPFGFGYRHPEQVQLIYMGFPIQQAMRQVSITEAQAIEFFEQNRQQYAQRAPQGQAPDYATIRDQVRQDVRRRKGYELVQQMVQAARALFFESERSLPEQGGYRQVTADFQPLSMREVADRIEQQFGVRPQVYTDYQDRGVATSELDTVAEIGQTVVASQNSVSFADYVHSAMELSAADDEQNQALRPLGLQTNIVSQPMVRYDGSMYLFRLTGASAAASPESLDEVREQVVADAKRKMAYDMLASDQARLTEMAKTQGLDAVGAEVGADVLNLPPMPRRSPNPTTGQLMVPRVVGVGRSEDLVLQMFDLAQSAAQDGSLAAAPAEARTGSTAVPEALTLAIYRIDEYQPITRSRFDTEASRPDLAPMISQTILRPADNQPLSLDKLSLRTGFIDRDGERDAAE